MMTLADLIARNALLHGDRPAVICRGRRYTHAEHAARIWRLANAFASLGLKPGDRVSFLSHNRAECLEIYGAAESGGFIATPLNWRLAPAELAKVLDDCRPSALIFEEKFGAVIQVLRTDGKLRGVRLIGLDQSSGDGAEYEELLAATSAARPAHRPAPCDTAHIIYTSGTTGNPKGVMWSHAALVGAAATIACQAGERPTDRLLVVMPLFHVGAKIEWLALQYMGGAACVLPAFDPLEVFAAIERERLTMAHFAPVMVKTLVEHERRSDFDLSSLTRVHYGSAPVAEANLRTAVAAFGPIFTQVYGMTEHLSTSMLLPYQQRLDGSAADLQRLRSAGQPYPGIELKIVDAELKPVAEGDVGAIGEVAVRSDFMMSGYWNNPEATAVAVRDGWLLTGDVGRIDADGFLYIVDRKKDMVISGGENIYCREVEDALVLHPDVMDAAVIGVPDAKWGEAVKAFVIVRDGMSVSEEELIAHTRTYIASYKRPRSIEFVAALPRLPHGKPDKKALRAPYWSDRQRGIA